MYVILTVQYLRELVYAVDAHPSQPCSSYWQAGQVSAMSLLAAEPSRGILGRMHHTAHEGMISPRSVSSKTRLARCMPAAQFPGQNGREGMAPRYVSTLPLHIAGS